MFSFVLGLLLKTLVELKLSCCCFFLRDLHLLIILDFFYQHHLEDVQASISATDQMSSTLHGRLKQKEKDVISLESR